VDAADLKRHDEYMVTRQEVDAHGNVKTKLFKVGALGLEDFGELKRRENTT
jgi:hypothetical protein